MLTTVRFHQSKGGTEKAMIDTANALTEMGHKVSIIYYDPKGDNPGFPLDTRVKTFNCRNEHIPFLLNGAMRKLRSLSLDSSSYYQKNALLKIKKLSSLFSSSIKNTPADVYITYEPKLSAMLSKEFGINGNVITTFHFNPIEISKRIDTKYLEPYISSAGPIQVLSNEFVNDTRSLFPTCKRIVFIPNAVPLQDDQSNLDRKIIICVGRISNEKNQKLLAESFGLIHNQYKDWQVQIWGETDTDKNAKESIKEIIKKYKMSDQFTLCGPTDEVLSKLKNASIFAFPSTSEGFGLALVEAMSMALPCVGLDECSSVNSIIKNNVNGKLTKNSPEAFSHALIELIEDKQLRQKFGLQAKLDSKAFSPSVIWPKWETLLFSVTKPNTANNFAHNLITQRM